MMRQEIQSVLDAYYEAFNANDQAGILSVFSEDAESIDLTMGRNMKGRKGLVEFIDETWSLSPYFKLEPTEVLVEDDSAAVRLFMSGAAKLDRNGAPASGQLWRIPSTSFFKFRDGQICWKADCWNMLAIPKQIGWMKTVPILLRSIRRRG